MRIIGYIENPVMKITVFKDNGKLSVKFESGLFEQTYKLRELDAIKNMEGIQKLVDDQFKSAVMEEFQRMNRIRNSALERCLPPKEDHFFEEII